MIKWDKFWLMLFIFLICQICVWFQFYSQLKWTWIKDNLWLPIVLSPPITYMFIKVTQIGYEAFSGQTWPVRFIGFSIGIIVFTICSTLILKEAFTMKTAICLGLCILIILVQMLWK